MSKDIDQYLVRRFGVDANAPHESFAQIAQNFVSRGRDGFGAGFIYETKTETSDQLNVSVTRCFFNDFFRRNNSPEVTPVVCAVDMVWADAINNSAHNAHFDRPTIMSDGDDACRFRFRRVVA